MKKLFSVFVIVSAGAYAYVLYYMLFRLVGREMVIMSESMLENYNYWNSINLIPFKTIAEYITAIADGSIRGHAIRNLGGNFLLLFPFGFYLPFFVHKAKKIGIYCLFVATSIIVIEIIQLATKTGSLDIDDFILNFTGALIGLVVFTRTPLRRLLELRTW
jgi:glycopeptide antibiotics resistance protein